MAAPARDTRRDHVTATRANNRAAMPKLRCAARAATSGAPAVASDLPKTNTSAPGRANAIAQRALAIALPARAARAARAGSAIASRSEEHTSELQSHSDLVCRLLLEKKKKPYIPYIHTS